MKCSAGQAVLKVAGLGVDIAGRRGGVVVKGWWFKAWFLHCVMFFPF